MAEFKSVNVCDTVTNNAYEALYKHDRGTIEVVIKEPLVTSEPVAEARAISELLKGGYAERWIRITSAPTGNIIQNDIISFKGVLWLVKEISFSFQAPKLLQTIKGVRYE